MIPPPFHPVPTHGRMRPPRSSPESGGAYGFTLIELLIVTAIIGILAAIAIPALDTAIQKTRQRATMSDMRTLANALHFYLVDEGHFPDGVTMAAIRPFLVPHITKVFPSRDAWKTDFGYATNGQSEYTIESYGADGLPGANISFATRFDFNRDIVHSDGMFAATPD